MRKKKMHGEEFTYKKKLLVVIRYNEVLIIEPDAYRRFMR